MYHCMHHGTAIHAFVIQVSLHLSFMHQCICHSGIHVVGAAIRRASTLASVLLGLGLEFRVLAGIRACDAARGRGRSGTRLLAGIAAGPLLAFIPPDLLFGLS